MFNFLSGMMKGGAGGMARGLGGGGAAGGGFMGRLQQGLRDPRTQQALGGMGAQMMGLDPQLGIGAAQGMQQRRLQQGFDRSIQPIQRQQIDPRQFMPQQRMQIPQQARMPMGFEEMGGGSWQDPRLQALFGRSRNPTY